MKMLIGSVCALVLGCFACSGGANEDRAASSAGAASATKCSSDGSDGAAVGTYEQVFSSDIGWTAIVLRSDCRYCFDNGDGSSSRDLHAGDGTWSASRRDDGTLGISLNHDDLVLTLDEARGTVDLTGTKLALQRDGDGFTCDGTSVKR
ncbi:MAG TPA: hypothetical protein VIF62_14525 [Labilithrix sp.]